MKYRVIQWATGAVGSFALREIIDHPDLELVGVWQHDPEKEGQDAGDLVGRAPTGVITTSSKDRILELEADVVVHCAKGYAEDGEPETLDEDIIRLLASGKNVVSTASYYTPRIEGPELMARLAEACATGNSTLFGTGIDPGFVCDRVPALMTGVCFDVQSVTMTEVFDMSKHTVGTMVFDTLGFGKLPDELSMDNASTRYLVSRILPAAVDKLARRLNVDLERLEVDGIELAFAKKDFDIVAGSIGEGTISGLQYTFSGYRAGESDPFITHKWVHYVGPPEDVPEHWTRMKEVEGGGAKDLFVKIDIVGRPSVHVEYTISDPEDAIYIGTATPCLLAIPEVCAAPAGFLEEPVFGSWKAPVAQ